MTRDEEILAIMRSIGSALSVLDEAAAKLSQAHQKALGQEIFRAANRVRGACGKFLTEKLERQRRAKEKEDKRRQDEFDARRRLHALRHGDEKEFEAFIAEDLGLNKGEGQ